jgi:outer membrane lipoprotein-sorting protein
MNRLCFSIIVVSLLFVCSSYAGDLNLSNPYVPSYPFKSAVIHYTIKDQYGHGKTSEGTEVVYIKSDRLAKVIKMAIPDPKAKGKARNIETLQVFDPDYVYSVNLTDKIGTKIDNPNKYTKPVYDRLSDKEKEVFHKRMDVRGVLSLDLLGLGKKVGTGAILGRECDVYESGKRMSPEELSKMIASGEEEDYFYMKSWIWRAAKIPLRTITYDVRDSDEMVATKIEENVRIPDSRFKVPSDVKITYDEEKSEFAKKEALARFNLYKTGNPMVIRMRLKPEEINPNRGSKTSELNK